MNPNDNAESAYDDHDDRPHSPRPTNQAGGHQTIQAHGSRNTGTKEHHSHYACSNTSLQGQGQDHKIAPYPTEGEHRAGQRQSVARGVVLMEVVVPVAMEN